MGALLELRGGLRKLQWYGEVNRRGFIKITKKLDKKVPEVTVQKRYLDSKVDVKPFATNDNLQKLITTINEWLAKLGEMKQYDDTTSIHSAHSIGRVSSKAILNLPQGLLDTVDQAIRTDDTAILMELLQEVNVERKDPEGAYQRLLLNLLQKAISCRSRACIAKLLGKIDTLEEVDDINQRNCLHRLLISLGRTKSVEEAVKLADPMSEDPADTSNFITPAAPPLLASSSRTVKEIDGSKDFDRNDPVMLIFEYVLDHLRPQQRSALQARDVYGRMPLHYAAQYGFFIICQIIISHMQAWDQFEVSEGIDASYWQDAEGLAPLHLSVMYGHPLTTRTLLEAENWKGPHDRRSVVRKHSSKSGEVLALATKENFEVIVALLVEAGVDLNHQDEQGETALHIAARFGYFKCAEALLRGTATQKADTEIAEKTFGWTPLHVASVDGHLSVVKLLIEAGADLERYDMSGWTAKEHASLRGHLTIAKLLAQKTSSPVLTSSNSSVTSSSPPSSISLADRKSNGHSNKNGSVKTTEPIKTFGHRYLTDESMVLVSLGTMDMRKSIPAVKLERIPLADAHSTQLDTALSVIVSASGAHGEPYIIDLPVQENISTEPIVFTTLDSNNVKIMFDIVPTYAGSKDQIVGRGVALLSSIKPSIGSNKMSLQGDVTVPIMAAHNLEVIGCVNFNFQIITPFKHPNMSITEKATYWKSMTSTMVIGHRGNGSLNVSPPPFASLNTLAKVWARMWLRESLYNWARTLYRYARLEVETTALLI